MSEQAAEPAAADGSPCTAGPGERLRARREQRGLAIEAVADSLHLAPRLIGAMESDDFGAFDAPVYAKGFLRKYAAFLGLSVDEVLAAYEAVTVGPSSPTLLPTMTVAAAKPPLAAPALAPALVVAALVLVGSYWWWAGRGSARLAAPAGAAGEARVPPAREAPMNAAATAPAVAAAPAEFALHPAVSTGPSTRGAEGIPASLAQPVAKAHRVPPATGSEMLVIHGVDECWTEVYAPSGTRLMYDIVHAGETRSIPGPGPWTVALGYADGVRLTVGERAVAVPAPRRHGAVIAHFVVGRDGAAQ